jgi:hypothetical protein
MRSTPRLSLRGRLRKRELRSRRCFDFAARVAFPLIEKERFEFEKPIAREAQLRVKTRGGKETYIHNLSQALELKNEWNIVAVTCDQ